MKIKSVPKYFWSLVLNFTTPRYALLFLNSEIYIMHVINHEWSRSIHILLRVFVWDTNLLFHVFFQQLVLERSSISCLYNMFCEFGIRDDSFLMLEDYIYIYIYNFLHGCWNYGLMKTNIDVMMLFKFEFKYVKLNFKAITSMEFSFDIKFYLLCSYGGCLFMKNRWKLFTSAL